MNNQRGLLHWLPRIMNPHPHQSVNSIPINHYRSRRKKCFLYHSLALSKAVSIFPSKAKINFAQLSFAFPAITNRIKTAQIILPDIGKAAHKKKVNFPIRQTRPVVRWTPPFSASECSNSGVVVAWVGEK